MVIVVYRSEYLNILIPNQINFQLDTSSKWNLETWGRKFSLAGLRSCFYCWLYSIRYCFAYCQNLGDTPSRANPVSTCVLAHPLPYSLPSSAVGVRLVFTYLFIPQMFIGRHHNFTK